MFELSDKTISTLRVSKDLQKTEKNTLRKSTDFLQEHHDNKEHETKELFNN